MQHPNTLTRAKRIIEARKSDPTTAVHAEGVIALELLGPETVARDADVRPLGYPQHGYLSPMAATEAFALELQRGLAGLATKLGIKVPMPTKYSPLHATPTLFKETWRARQMVDECGVPYPFYVQHAVAHWLDLGHKRMPRPSQITSPDIAVHVMEQWADPANRWAYPLFEQWDERFDADRYEGDPIQDRALNLIDQRVADAVALGREPAEALLCLLDAYISEDEARRRFGDALVDQTLELEALGVAEHIEINGVGPDVEVVGASQGL